MLALFMNWILPVGTPEVHMQPAACTSGKNDKEVAMKKRQYGFFASLMAIFVLSVPALLPAPVEAQASMCNQALKAGCPLDADPQACAEEICAQQAAEPQVEEPEPEPVKTGPSCMDLFNQHMKPAGSCVEANAARQELLPNCFGNLSKGHYRKVCPDDNPESVFYEKPEPEEPEVTHIASCDLGPAPEGSVCDSCADPNANITQFGGCACSEPWVDRGGACHKGVACVAGVERKPGTFCASCQDPNAEIGKDGLCQCGEGFEEQDGACVVPTPSGVPWYVWLLLILLILVVVVDTIALAKLQIWFHERKDEVDGRLNRISSDVNTNTAYRQSRQTRDKLQDEYASLLSSIRGTEQEIRQLEEAIRQTEDDIQELQKDDALRMYASVVEARKELDNLPSNSKYRKKAQEDLQALEAQFEKVRDEDFDPTALEARQKELQAEQEQLEEAKAKIEQLREQRDEVMEHLGLDPRTANDTSPADSTDGDSDAQEPSPRS